MRILFLLLLFLSLRGHGEDLPAINKKVYITRANGIYQLHKDGKPYFIKGAAGYEHFDKLKAYGGNSIRIWSTQGAKKVLDQAHALGLTVTLGLDLAQQRKGFDYSDKKAVALQFERIKKDIQAFKDHPALLMWGVGNEVEQFGENYEVWNAVNDIVNYIHKADPHHPTTTMLAGVPRKHIKEIVKRCPKLDVLSLNIFKLITTVADDIKEAGWNGPFLVSEWGATGYWEAEMVPWNTFMEETSTQKARLITERYREGILKHLDKCIGSYVFYWGWKQARTHTLLSLFSEDSLQYGMLDALHREWTGRDKINKAPEISGIKVDTITRGWAYLGAGRTFSCRITATDPEKDRLFYKWEIYPESTDKKEGGDEEKKPVVLNGAIVKNQQNAITLKAPKKKGAYRVFVFVTDQQGNIASANFPFYVKG